MALQIPILEQLTKMREDRDAMIKQRDELLGIVKAVAYHSIPVTVDGIKCAAFPWVEYESLVAKAKGGAS